MPCRENKESEQEQVDRLYKEQEAKKKPKSNPPKMRLIRRKKK